MKDWRCDEEGCYCPECGKAPQFCKCGDTGEAPGDVVKSMEALIEKIINQSLPVYGLPVKWIEMGISEEVISAIYEFVKPRLRRSLLSLFPLISKERIEGYKQGFKEAAALDEKEKNGVGI